MVPSAIKFLAFSTVAAILSIANHVQDPTKGGNALNSAVCFFVAAVISGVVEAWPKTKK